MGRSPASLAPPRRGSSGPARHRLPCAAALAALAALSLGGACRRDPDAAPSCGAVASHFMQIAEDDLGSASVDGATRRAVRAQLPAMRDSLATACTDSQWTERVRRCLRAARDHVGFETCQQELTEAQRRALDRAARGTTDSP
jgi:hypothetical protein